MWLLHPLFLGSMVGAAGMQATLPRAIGDYCETLEGVGTCQRPSNCKGISTSSPYCLTDATTQCCVPQKCSTPYITSLCRHISQGCLDGSLIQDHCSGDSSSQCCVKAPGSDQPSCSNPAEDDCSFYSTCLETRVQCGDTGYPIGYGLKYCTKFQEARAQFTAEGNTWITKTMLCLQRSLISYATGEETTTCAKLHDIAFGTHPGCYVSSGLCLLPLQDWEALISVVSLKELFGSLESLEAVLNTGAHCADFFLWLIASGVF